MRCAMWSERSKSEPLPELRDSQGLNETARRELTMEASLVEIDVMIIMIVLQKLRSRGSSLAGDIWEVKDTTFLHRQLYLGGRHSCISSPED